MNKENNAEELIVYRCGSKVLINDINIQGYITGISIRDNRVMYEISYFLNNTYLSTWFYDYQFCFDNIEKMKIGFK
jgi:hypothetical protein